MKFKISPPWINFYGRLILNLWRFLAALRDKWIGALVGEEKVAYRCSVHKSLKAKAVKIIPDTLERVLDARVFCIK